MAKWENISYYVVQNSQYPPPTMKVTNFNFLSQSGVFKRCAIFAGGIPGEICNMQQSTSHDVSTSHGCCIDAYACTIIVPTYRSDDIVEQVMAIASLVSLFVCSSPSDLLEPGLLSQQQLEKSCNCS